jgi:hypothetical protein
MDPCKPDPEETVEKFRDRLHVWLASGDAEREFQAYRMDNNRPAVYMIFSEWLAERLIASGRWMTSPTSL